MLRLPGGGQAQLDLTFVLNVVHAMMLATDNDGLRSGAIYNITNQEPQRLVTMLDSLLNQQLHINYTLQPVPYSLLSVVAAGMELVASMTQKEPLLTRYSVGAVYFDMTLNSERAINELGYRPRYSMAEGLCWLASGLARRGVASMAKITTFEVGYCTHLACMALKGAPFVFASSRHAPV